MSDPEPGLFNFTSVPDGYRQYLQPAVFDPWARELLAFVPPSLGDVVLDIAAGTGAVAHAAAPIVGPEGRVIASDVSPIMLAGARLEATDDRAAVEPLESPADRLAVPDGIVDVALLSTGSAVHVGSTRRHDGDARSVAPRWRSRDRRLVRPGSGRALCFLRSDPRTTAFPNRTRTHTTPRSSPCRSVRSNTCSQRCVPSMQPSARSKSPSSGPSPDGRPWASQAPPMARRLLHSANSNRRPSSLT